MRARAAACAARAAACAARAAAASLAILCGCGLTVTNEPPTYDELPPEDQAIVDRILASVTAFDAAVEARGGPGIDEVIDRDAVQVHFQGLVMAANFGDGYLRLSIWEHLTAGQRAMIASWWSVDEATAGDTYYPKFFYDYLATHLAAIEWIYQVQGVDRVLADRPRFKVERDAQYLAVAFYEETDPTTMIDVDAPCASLRAQHEDWESRYDQEYFTDHIVDIADPESPTEYFWFFCRWLDDAQARTYTFPDEMELIFRRCQMWEGGCAWP